MKAWILVVVPPLVAGGPPLPARFDPLPVAGQRGPGPASHLLFDARLGRPVLLVPSRATGRESLWELVDGTWRLVTDSGPPARELGAAAFDLARGRLVLHGGMGLGNREDRRDDTWEWDRTAWRRAADVGPGPRDHHAMVFDEARGRVVMVGGADRNDSLATEVWEWDGERWHRVVPPLPGPGGRAHFALAYDAVRRQVVLFGGMGQGYRVHGDTWAWDGRAWRELSQTGPPRRSHHRMTFDRQAGVVVLFGGLRTGRPAEPLGDTWRWDGTRWTQVDGPGPSPRSGHVMVHDPVTARTLLYGGGAFDGRVSTGFRDTWSWSRGRWLQVE
ncbi:MAG: hypothetical protein IT352_05790 [Gemmatimonadales bacterium]|nr:hypothetical protein [Gemmatimonadales bacterium]